LGHIWLDFVPYLLWVHLARPSRTAQQPVSKRYRHTIAASHHAVAACVRSAGPPVIPGPTLAHSTAARIYTRSPHGCSLSPHAAACVRSAALPFPLTESCAQQQHSSTAAQQPAYLTISPHDCSLSSPRGRLCPVCSTSHPVPPVDGVARTAQQPRYIATSPHDCSFSHHAAACCAQCSSPQPHDIRPLPSPRRCRRLRRLAWRLHASCP